MHIKTRLVASSLTARDIEKLVSYLKRVYRAAVSCCRSMQNKTRLVALSLTAWDMRVLVFCCSSMQLIVAVLACRTLPDTCACQYRVAISNCSIAHFFVAVLPLFCCSVAHFFVAIISIYRNNSHRIHTNESWKRCERQDLTSSTRRHSLYVIRLCRKMMPWGEICCMKCNEDESVIWYSEQLRHDICKDTYVSDAAMKRHRLLLVTHFFVKHLSWVIAQVIAQVIAHVSMSPRAWVCQKKPVVCQKSPGAPSGGGLQPSAAARPPEEDHWSEDSENVDRAVYWKLG